MIQSILLTEATPYTKSQIQIYQLHKRHVQILTQLHRANWLCAFVLNAQDIYVFGIVYISICTDL